MQQTLTVVLQSAAATWCRELSQEQVQAIADALRNADRLAMDLASLADNAGDMELAASHYSRAALCGGTRKAWLDIAHADREEG